MEWEAGQKKKKDFVKGGEQIITKTETKSLFSVRQKMHFFIIKVYTVFFLKF